MSGPEDIAAALARLRAGGLVAFPTETVYGLGADAFNASAIARVFELKGRPAVNPLIVHVSGDAMAQQVVSSWPREASIIAAKFWPGPLTLVLPKKPSIPDIVTGGGPTVGVRCPDHLLTLSLIEAFGKPLVGPSANPSGRISPTTAAHVRASFTDDQVLTLDGGPCRGGIESTVLSLVGEPRILRPGLITADELSKALGRAVLAHTPGQVEASSPMSPGLLASHYAPRARTELADRDDIARQLLASREPIAAILLDPLPAPHPHAAILMPRAADAYAARLYAALREADELTPSVILIERPPSTGPIWEAIADRLGRAAFRP